MTLVITSYGNGALLTKVIMGVSYIMSNSNYLLLIQLPSKAFFASIYLLA